MKRPILAIAMGALTLMGTTHSLKANAEVDPNFYIYLCFGQSNMEGNAQPESMDKSNVDKRFKLLATCNYSSPKRNLGEWYTATPPLVNPNGGLGPTDYFGRTMVAALPPEVKIGVVPVAMGGSPIEMFDKDKYQQKMKDNPNEWWVTLAKNHYGGNPYGRLIEMGKKAQEVGVIKGILLHQGCSNNGDPNWPNMVKKIYNDMLNDLGLSADSVPLFVGETLRQENGGSCYGHNVQVDRMPSVVPTSHVISSKDLPGNGNDPWHFNATGYRILGRRYAFSALELMGCEQYADTAYVMPTTYKKFYATKTLTAPAMAMPGQRIPVTATFQDNHKEDVTDSVRLSSSELTIVNGALPSNFQGTATVELTYTDFLRTEKTISKELDIRFFPFKEDCLTLFSGTASFSAKDTTFTMTANSHIGWCYDAGADMSDYKYLVFKLKEQQKCGGSIRVYDQNNANSSTFFVKAFNTNKLVYIDLKNMVRSGKTIDPSHVCIVSLRATTKGTIHIEDVYLTNEDITGIENISNDKIEKTATYDMSGRQMHSQSLRPGLYLNDGKKILIK